MELSEKKIETLRGSVNQINGHIGSLCDIREEMFETRRPKWLEEVAKIRACLESDQMLLFIGPFSSGKSTFVNALLGVKDLLPTSSRPCTAIVTELSFKRGGGNEGMAYKYGSEPEPMPFEELKKLIDGPRGVPVGTLAQYDHIELMYDVDKLPETHPLRLLQDLNVRIVDCPGYGSIYVTKDAIIERYIERANFTFWMTPADKFGGAATESRLSHIKKRTSTLIPVITMSDLIDDGEKERVTDEFYEHLGDLFDIQGGPRFVSALKYQQSVELAQTLDPKNPNKEVQIPKEEREKIQQKMDRLRFESGVEQIFEDMVVNSQKRSVNEANIRSSLHDLSELFKEMALTVNKEEKYWHGKLQEAGWSPNDRYKKLTEVKNSVDSWINMESEKAASKLEALMNKELLEYIMKVEGKVETGEALGIVNKIWNNELLRYKDEWAQHFADEYGKAYKQFSADSSGLEPPSLGKITAELTNMVMSVLESFKEAGFRTVATGGIGAVVWALTPAVGSLWLVGSALATITTIVGPVLIGIAAIPLIPTILKKIKSNKEQYRKEIEGKLREWMREMNMVPAIAVILNKQNDTLYKRYRDEFDAELRPLHDNYEQCGKIKEGLRELKEIISSNFPDEFKG